MRLWELQQNDTGIGTAKELENLTGSNTEEFSNSTLGNLMANISEGVSNATGNNSALKNLTTGVIQEMSNITSNMVQNQTGNQTGNYKLSNTKNLIANYTW